MFMECRYVCVTEIGMKIEIVGDYSGVKNLLYNMSSPASFHFK